MCIVCGFPGVNNRSVEFQVVRSVHASRDSYNLVNVCNVHLVAKVDVNYQIQADVLKNCQTLNFTCKVLKHAQHFLNRINTASSSSRGRKTPSSASQAAARRAQRVLVKDGYLVEVSTEGANQRKLRHVFLYSDLLLCAKQKSAAGYNLNFDPNNCCGIFSCLMY